jgi:hypothetical protein
MDFMERLYIEKMFNFVRMKKKLTLFLDEPLIDKMKSLAQIKGTSISLMVEQIFVQQPITLDSSPLEKPNLEEDPFITKFGGLLKQYNQCSDAELKSMSMEMRLTRYAV